MGSMTSLLNPVSAFSGGDSGSSTARLQGGYDRGYDSYQAGVDPWSLPGMAPSDLSNAFVQGWNEKANSTQAASSFSGFEMPEIDLGQDFNSYLTMLQQQQEENQRNLLISQRDELYSARMDAASSSADYVNSQIAQERANAELFGIHYDITDEDKQTRINDYFATVWGEGQETQLAQLMAQAGAPSGHTEFSVVRGDGASLKSTEGSETNVSTSKGVKPGPITSLSKDEELGGGNTVLG